MPKQKKSKLTYLLPVLYGSIVILAVLCLIMIFGCIHKSETDSDENSPSISLGSMQYDLSNGMAVRRDDVSVKSLQVFLEEDAAHEGCSDQTPAYEHVIAYTKDETQVFVKYGCGAADSPIYAVKTNGIWKMLSPTNHFDSFGIPDCKYLADNFISKEIAPVCVVVIGPGAPTYNVR